MARTRADGPTSAGQLLALVRSGRAGTRGELQELTGLSRSTLGFRLEGLLRNGWLKEAGSTTSTGGRPPVVLRFDETHAVVLAADLDTRHARAAVLDLAGTVLAERTGALVIADGPKLVLDQLVTWFKELLADPRTRSAFGSPDDPEAGLTPAAVASASRHEASLGARGAPASSGGEVARGSADVQGAPASSGRREVFASAGGRGVVVGAGVGLAGIGVSVPGPVEFDSGRAIRPPIMPGWDEYPIGEHLNRVFGVPVLVDNDANAMALGEQAAGYPDCPAFVLVKVSTGIGAGVVIDGSVFRGIDGGAGDIGHIRVRDTGDAKCQCGSLGCLAAVASGGAVAAALTDLGVTARSGADVRALLAAGQPDALRLAREAGRRVGEVLATVVSVVNPGVLMITGDLAGNHFVTGVREVLYQVTLPRATRHLEVVTGQLADHAALTGMARLVVDEVYAPAAVDARLRQ